MQRGLAGAAGALPRCPRAGADDASGGRREAVPEAADPALEARMTRITSELRCLVCQNQTIADSTRRPSPPTCAGRRRELLKQGKSDQEIVDYMTARYGDFVLYPAAACDRPPVLLWFGPALMLIIGAAVLVLVLRRRSRMASSAFEPDDEDDAMVAAGNTARSGQRAGKLRWTASSRRRAAGSCKLKSRRDGRHARCRRLRTRAPPRRARDRRTPCSATARRRRGLRAGSSPASSSRFSPSRWWATGRPGSPALAGVGPGSVALASSARAAPSPDGAASAAAPDGLQQIAAMVDKLAARMKERPDDAEGWLMLARSYSVLGRFGEAIPAFPARRRAAAEERRGPGRLRRRRRREQGPRRQPGIDGPHRACPRRPIRHNRKPWRWPLRCLRPRRLSDRDRSLAEDGRGAPAEQRDVEAGAGQHRRCPRACRCRRLAERGRGPRRSRQRRPRPLSRHRARASPAR